jgi:hypothetical protein
LQFSVPHCCSHNLDLLLIPVLAIIQGTSYLLTFLLGKSTRLFAEVCIETGGDGRTIVKCIDHKWHGRVWTDFIWLRLGRVGGGGALVSKVINLRVP